MAKRILDSREDKRDKKKRIVEILKNQYNQDGCAPLHKAVISNNFNIMRDLLRAGADSKSTLRTEYDEKSRDESEMHEDCLGDNIAHLAMQYGHQEILEFLAKDYIELFAARNITSLTPLGSAAAEGKIDAVKFFLEKVSPRLSAYKASEDCALTAALHNHHWEIARVLLEQGYKVNNISGSNEYKLPDMELAVLGDNLQIVELLYRHAADIEAINSDGDTLLNVAVRHIFIDEPFVEFLLMKGARLNIKNEENNNAVDLASNLTCDIPRNIAVKQSIFNALATDLICGDDIQGFKLEKVLQECSKEPINHNMIYNNISRINHKLMHRGTMSLKEILDNADRISKNAAKFESQATRYGITKYLKSFTENVKIFEKLTATGRVPSLFKLSLDSLNRSGEWDKLTEELVEYESAQARAFLSGDYVTYAVKQNTLARNLPKLNASVVRKGVNLNQLSDLFKCMGVELIGEELLDVQEAVETAAIGEHQLTDDYIA